MNQSPKITVEELAPMRIARVSIEDENPEIKAFSTLIKWAEKNAPEALEKPRFFGFNDPCPEEGQKIYKYEAWMTVGDDARAEDNVTIETYKGGKYAVRVTPLSDIVEIWHGFEAVVKAAGYEVGKGPGLEEPLTHPVRTPFDKARMKLYFPIR